MTVTRMRTMDLPAEQRFALWHDLTVGSHIPIAIDSDHRDDFRATIEVHDFGLVQLSRLRYPALRGERTERLIRQSDPDVLLVSHVPHGRQLSRRDWGESVADASNIVVHTSSQAGTVINDAPITNIVFQLPRTMLDPKGILTDRLLLAPIPATRGIGALLVHVLTDLAEHGDSHPPAVITQLTTTALDLLTAAARIVAGARFTLPDDSRTRIRQIQIHSYIRQRLADPNLTPTAVAAAHGLSMRQLHRVFQAEGTTPSAWIRRQRLEQCRRDLGDPELASRPVVAIGARWGYPDPTSFNRAFRREFGIPPGEYREQFGQGTDTVRNGE